MEWYERWIYLPSKLLSILSGHTAPLSSWSVAGSVLDEFFYGAHNAESTEIDIICIHSMVILSRRSIWQRGLKISAHKFLPCFLLTACLKMIRSNCFFLNALQDGVHETSIPQLFESSKWHCGTQGRTTLICIFPSLNISPRQMTKFRAKTYVQVIY